ncbi:MAG: hypothetical protein IKP58_04010 [Victivallales bacterium]|nr:hypothetical protein [Victivallales bacterium]
MKSNIRWWLSVIVALLAGAAYSKDYQWTHYGEWYDVTNNAKLVNEAKKAAIADQRPMLVLYTRSGTDCSHCKALWQGALCDGGSKCAGTSCPLYSSKHPWKDYAKEKKIILLYINLSQIQDWFTYLKKQHPMTYTGAYPVFALFHVKDDADCENDNKQFILNTSRVDCIGASYYSTGSRINGVKLENTFESFKNLYESYFEKCDTYGLELDPEPDDTSDEITDVIALNMADFTKDSADSQSITSDKKSVWFSFNAVSGKTYNFKFQKGTGSSAVKVGIYANTGTADKPNYDKKTPLMGPQDVVWNETVTWTATQSGLMLVKVYSEATSPKVTFSTDYVTLPDGNHLLNPSQAAGTATWGRTFGTRRPAVVAFIDNDIWDDNTLDLAKAVQEKTFTTTYGGATWYVLTSAQGGLAPTTKPELVYIVKKNNADVEMGRVSGNDATDVDRFAQYKKLEDDDYEPENNEYATTDGVLTVGTLSGVMLGGVDIVDWYEFTSTADNQKWTFTVGGDNAAAVTMTVTDADGKAVATTMDGTSISYTVPAKGTKMYVKLETSTASPFSYMLTSEIKVANYTVQFAASDYTVMADADFLEIAVDLNKLIYKSGAITASLTLDDSTTAFNREVFFLAGGWKASSTNVDWTARENTNNNDYPKTKTVKVMLGDTEKESFWEPGEKEKTVTVSLSTSTDGVEVPADKATATIHIRNVNIPSYVGDSTISYETFAADQPEESQKKVVENCISVPEAYAGNEIFWELIEGEVPEGIDIDIRQHAEGERGYDVVVSGTAVASTETYAKLLFFMRKDAGKKQIIRGDEFTVTFTINEKRMVNTGTRGGWNLMAIPWDMKVNEESEQEFQTTNAGNIYTSDGNSYVKSEGQLKKGSAYWFFVKEGGQNPLTGIKDTSVDEAKMIEEALQGMGGKWYFGADPGVENCEARWIWDAKEKKFVPMEDKTVGEAGWWYIRKAE